MSKIGAAYKPVNSPVTIGALTLADGVGTNDGTIGAITGDASVIAAVQELAAKINAIRAEMSAQKIIA